MLCPACGLGNPPDTRFCAACGTALGVGPPPVPNSRSHASTPIPAAVAQVPIVEGQHQTEGFEPVYARVPGPVDRESFFAAQRRYRRQTWRLAAACTIAAIVTGIPLSLVLTPLIYAIILVLTRLIHIITPVPVAVWNAYEWVGLVIVKGFQSLDNPATPNVSETNLGNIPLDTLLTLAAIWIIPGILLMLMLWPAMSLLFRASGVGGVLLSLGTREPRLDDFEERQLVNTIEEMAIAAGLPAPTVVLMDVPVANAAVVGTSPDDAVIVVTRLLIDELDRDETQSVLAHLIASIGNGDLRAALSVIAIFQTLGFASALIRFPIDGQARSTVWRVIRFAFGRRRAGLRDQEAESVSELLTAGLEDFGEGDDLEKITNATPPQERPGPKLKLVVYIPALMLGSYLGLSIMGKPHAMKVIVLLGLITLAVALIWYQRTFASWVVVNSIGWARAMILLPYYIGAMMPLLVLMVIKNFLLDPLIGRLWRARRFLADATAVQLTRNPDGLARGLIELTRRGGVIPGGAWATPLFVVGSETANLRLISDYQQRSSEAIQAELRALDPEGDDTGARRALIEARALRRQSLRQSPAMIEQLQDVQHSSKAGRASQGSGGFMAGGTTSLHPAIRDRLNRLQAMGASVTMDDPAARAKSPLKSKLLGAILVTVLVPLIGIAVVLGIFVLVMLIGISLFFTAIMMMLVYGLFQIIAPT